MLQEEQSLTTKHDTKTILVVEDDADNLWLYTEALALLTSYHVKAVRNGSFALDFVQHIKPDLFILDYRLPNMNGIQLYDRLHATPGLEHIPAIIISSITSEEVVHEIEGRHLLRVKKPFHVDMFLDTIKQMLA